MAALIISILATSEALPSQTGGFTEAMLREFALIESTAEHRCIASLSDEAFEAECLAQMRAELARRH